MEINVRFARLKRGGRTVGASLWNGCLGLGRRDGSAMIEMSGGNGGHG
jgi:hypothetical protein